MKFFISLIVAVSVFITVSVVSAHQQVAVIPLHSAKDLQNVITVSPSGGDFTNPVAALNSITNASFSNLYHVILGPGVYDLAQPLQMKPFDSISGAGPITTLLRGSISTNNWSTSAIIIGADNSSISDLMVENHGGGTNSAGIYTNGSQIIHDISVFASGASKNYAIYNDSSSPVFYEASVKGTVSNRGQTTIKIISQV